MYALMIGGDTSIAAVGHVFVSTEAGSTWRPTGSAAVSPACNAITVDPQDAYRLYASFWLEGVFRSDDGGETWSPAREGLPLQTPTSSWFKRVSLLAASREHPGKVVAVVGGGTRDKIFISSDYGDHWFPAVDLLGTYFIEFIEFSAGTPEVAYVGSKWGEGLQRSTDGGATWAPITSLGSPEVLSIAFDPTNQARLWVGAAGVHLSTDGGLTWSLHTAGLDDPGEPGSTAKINSMAVDAGDPTRLVAASGFGTFRSTDSGLTWSQLLEPLQSLCWWGIVEASPAPGGPWLGGACGTGVLSLEGNRWVPTRSGLHAVPTFWLASDPQRPEVAYAASGSQYRNMRALQRTTDGGHTWHNVTADLDRCGVSSLAVDPADGRHLLVPTMCVGDGLASTTDGGDTWSLVDLPEECTDLVGPIVFAPSDPRWVYAFGFDGMLRSSDGGVTWEVVNAEIRAPRPKAAAVHPAHPEVVYAGVRLPLGPLGAGSLAVSTDGGRSWTDSSGALPPPPQPCCWGACYDEVTWIGIHPDRADRVLVVTRTWGLYISEDAGQTWDASAVPVVAGGVAMVRDQPDTLIVGGLDGGGVFISEDAGQTWRRLGVGLDPAPRVLSLTSSTDGNLVYAGTSTSVLHLHRAIAPRRPRGRLGRP